MTPTDNNNHSTPPPQRAALLSIVVVAKAPVAGQCKTRLIPEFGKVGSARLARAMLLDVLTTLSECVRTNDACVCVCWCADCIDASDMIQSVQSVYLSFQTMA